MFRMIAQAFDRIRSRISGQAYEEGGKHRETRPPKRQRKAKRRRPR